MEKMENQDCVVKQDRQAQQDHGESQDSRENLDMLASLDQRETLALQVLLDHQADQAMRGIRVFQVSRDDRDPPGKLVPQAQLDPQVLPAHQDWVLKEIRVRLVTAVSQAWSAPQDHQDTQAQWENQAVTAFLVKMEQQACQGTMGRQVKRVNQEPLARGALQVREVGRGLQVVEDTMLKMHNPLWAQLDQGEKGGALVQRVSPGRQDNQEHQEMMRWLIMMKSRTSYGSRSSRSLMNE